MTETWKRLNEFVSSPIAKWIFLGLFFGAVFFFDRRYDHRYLTIEDAKKKEREVHRIRQEDWQNIDKRFNKVEASITDVRDYLSETNSVQRSIEGKLSRIEGQLEILIQYYQSETNNP